MSIEFRLDVEKSVEAAAFLLKRHGKPMQAIGLLKMLYIADRMALNEIEQSITSDRSLSSKYGPILSGIQSLIAGKTVSTCRYLNEETVLAYWSQFIGTEGQYVSLLKDPGISELCEAETEILTLVYQKWGVLDPLDTDGWTDHLPEWQPPNDENGDSLAAFIQVEDILRNIGKTEEEIAQIQSEIQREQYLNDALSSNNLADKIVEPVGV